MALHSSLRALKYYNFRLYFVGQAISLIGTWMQRLAVSWLVYNVTHSAFWLGVVAFAGQIPVSVKIIPVKPQRYTISQTET